MMVQLIAIVSGSIYYLLERIRYNYNPFFRTHTSVALS